MRIQEMSSTRRVANRIVSSRWYEICETKMHQLLSHPAGSNYIQFCRIIVIALMFTAGIGSRVF
jgi:hypothetical protein